MKIGITQKLFVAILITNVLVVAAFAVAVQVSVNRGFRAYVVEREERRLELIAARAADAYAQKGNWDALRDASTWQSIARIDDLPRRGPFPFRDGARMERPPPDDDRAIFGSARREPAPASPRKACPRKVRGPRFAPPSVGCSRRPRSSTARTCSWPAPSCPTPTASSALSW